MYQLLWSSTRKGEKYLFSLDCYIPKGQFCLLEAAGGCHMVAQI